MYKQIIAGGIIWGGLTALGYWTYRNYFSSRSIDEKVTAEALKILKRNGEFNSLWNHVELTYGAKIRVVSLSPEQGSELGAVHAYWQCFCEGSRISELRICCTRQRPLYSLSFQIHQLQKLDEFIRIFNRAHQLDVETFASECEIIEYAVFKAHHEFMQRGVEKGHYLDDFIRELPFVSLEEFLLMQEESGHTELYRKEWSRLKTD